MSEPWGKKMAQTGAIVSDASLIAVWQDTQKRIGQGFSETIQYSSGHTVLQVQSAVAQKFVGAEQHLYTHLDLRFVELKSEECTAGVLADSAPASGPELRTY